MRAVKPSLRLSMADITGKGSGLPNRYVLIAPEKLGKTSFGAQTPSPIFVQTRGETGLETLIDAGQLPEVSHFPEIKTYHDLAGAIESLTTEEHKFKTLLIDTLNGAAQLCCNAVCDREFGGDWSERGFTGYMRGYEIAQTDWLLFLASLDRLRAERRMSILTLCHAKIKTFKNPTGPDYDKYQPDMHDKLWGNTHKWADAILFMNFDTKIREEKHGKTTVIKSRTLYTEQEAGHVAGNRLGLPETIDMGNSPAEAWANFKTALAAGKNGNTQQEEK